MMPYGPTASNGQSSDRSNAGDQLASKLSRQVDAEQAGPADRLRLYVEARKSVAETTRSEVNDRLINAKKLTESKYTATEEETIEREGGTNVFKGVTGSKVRTAKAWIFDIYSPKDGRIYGLQPTPLPDLPGSEINELKKFAEPLVAQFEANKMAMTDVEQEQALLEMKVKVAQLKDALLTEAQADAEEKAKNMNTLIDDQMDEGGFRAALNTFVSHVCTYPAGFIKGPVLTNKPVLKWQGGKAVVDEKVILQVTAPSPMDIYPSPGAKSVQDGFLFERMQLERNDLYMCLDQPGFKSASIRALLAGMPDGVEDVTLNNEYERKNLEQRSMGGYVTQGNFDVWEYWGYAPGALLKEWGMDMKEFGKFDPLKEYSVRAWLVPGRCILHCSINPHPLGHRPYSAASVISAPDTIWGKGIPDLIAQDQKLLNLLLRAMVNNTALSSQPQMMVDLAMMAPGEAVTKPHPNRVWQVDSSRAAFPGQTSKPIDFFVVPNTVSHVMPLYQMTAKDMDEISGIPAYAHGDSHVGGAGNTASGLSMLMNSASKVMRDVIRNIDEGGIIPLVQRFAWHNLMFSKDDNVKTDVQVMAIGSLSLFVKEQLQMSRQNFLQLVANPAIMDIIGMRGMATILRELAEDLKLPHGNIVPTDEELAAKEQGMQQMQALASLQEQGVIPPEFNPQQPEPLIPQSMVQALFAQKAQLSAEPPPEYVSDQLGADTVVG